jgi:hypothetical protein
MSPSSEGTENPLEARTMAGGTVIQPTLKHICDNAMVCTVAPSGSSDAMSVSFVFSEVEVGVGVMLGKGVAVVDIVSTHLLMTSNPPTPNNVVNFSSAVLKRAASSV